MKEISVIVDKPDSTGVSGVGCSHSYLCSALVSSPESPLVPLSSNNVLAVYSPSQPTSFSLCSAEALCMDSHSCTCFLFLIYSRRPLFVFPSRFNFCVLCAWRGLLHVYLLLKRNDVRIIIIIIP